MKAMSVTLFGLGRAGLPLACVMAETGFIVRGVDKSMNRVKQIRNGENPYPDEPGLGESLKRHCGRNIVATKGGSRPVHLSDYHIILVPMGIKPDGDVDSSAIFDVLKTIARNMRRGSTVVMETTVPVGFMKVVRDMLEALSGMECGKDFYLVYSPERMYSGKAISRYRDFEKVVSADDDASLKKGQTLYSTFCEHIVCVSPMDVAAMGKIAEGMYRDVNIALANEVYRLCHEYGLPFDSVKSISKHRYCDLLEPGIGVGGHCIPVYPRFIISDMEERGKAGLCRLSSAAREVNDGMVDFWAARIERVADRMHRPRILIAGLTYRPGVKSLEGSRALALYRILHNDGYDVYAYDSMHSMEELRRLGLRHALSGECHIIFDAHEGEMFVHRPEEF